MVSLPASIIYKISSSIKRGKEERQEKLGWKNKVINCWILTERFS